MITHLSGDLGTAGWEAVEARGSRIVAGGLVDGAIETLGEEHSLAVWAAQGHNVDDL